MPFIKEIVSLINTRLQESTLARPSFQRGMFYGLAKQVQKVSDQNLVQPVIFDQDGKDIDPTVDDKYPFSIYHRAVSSTFVLDPNSFDATIERTQMIAIVYGNFDTIKMDQTQLGYLIASGISGEFRRDEVYPTGINQVRILPANANYDSAAIMRQEHGYADYTLPPQDSYFSITYLIEMKAGKDCIPCTECE